MQCKTMVLWWFVNKEEHPLLTEEDKTFAALAPLVAALFPGIDYYSQSGFREVALTLVIPALQKQHPELLGVPAADITGDATTPVAEVLASKGYEWQTDPNWMTKFNEMLAAA